MKALLLYLIFSLYLTQGMAQNLVRNPSLEQLKGGVIGFKGVSGTPDVAAVEGKVVQFPPYFNAYQSNTPSRQVSTIEFGEVCLCQWFSFEASELTQVELTKPLRKNQEYVVSLYTIRASTIEPPISEITVHFLNKPLPAIRQVYGLKDHPLTTAAIPYTSLKNDTGTPLASRTEWTKVSGLYKARGGERYLLLGNFLGANAAALEVMNPETEEVEEELKSSKKKGTYYCYDNISVVPKPAADKEADAIPDAAPPLASATDAPIAIGSTLTLDDVNFAFGEHTIQSVAFPLLDSLAAFMATHPQVGVRIVGHTDDVGTDADNLALSQRRATTVKVYLEDKGIAAHRISASGLGESAPRADNLTDENRALNRRVEIEIFEE
ncbi:OmpA family protein [Pontibacter ramchanderi]|uniref:Outer membrane protein OmpA-like peptidoglycan-associated protein n=1 Tax=Pontibacter ramchanderi TaxID=1179743 RepID=A0A2N3V3D7_9BACT|nr:OmpA family protein [Pontibacter ramchanderi]PKV76139.1 outer membrane protein OmpA-like peptidoglycan-associated protein [Pontibacter ramchanderi]